MNARSPGRRRVPRLPLPALVTLALLALAPAAVSADDANADQGALAFTVNVPEGKVALPDVHAAVLKAAAHRGWTINDDRDTRVVIHLLKRGHDDTVTFLISEKSVEAYCVGYIVDKEGNHKKPDHPTGWLKNLEHDITETINAAVLAAGK